MTGLERSRSKIGKLRPLLGQMGFDAAADASDVRLMEYPRRPAATPIEQRLVSTLKETGPISMARLVKRVAAELYRDELRRGAGVLDIGLIGDRLFNRDIVRELNAGNGILWEIDREGKSK